MDAFKIPPTPYADLNQVLLELINSVQVVLKDNFVGAYLQGSFAVGDFDRDSDVDFIIVSEYALSDAEVGALQAVHGRIFQLESAWAQHLEGSYFTREVLQSPVHKGKDLWYLDNGSNELELTDHCNTLLVRWIVRDMGVPLIGPDPKALVNAVDVADLRREILRVITEWGQEILDNPERFNNRFYQMYIVLNFSRMLHDLQRGYPGSKLAGANWAKANLDPMWRGLIDRTWAGRPKPEISVRQRADADDFAATLEYLRYIIDLSKEYAAENM